ncbi:hypothetical protein GNF83_15025, partial [Clostridium perfringens]|nr:hypothetical protein [Clostridium perfringens]
MKRKYLVLLIVIMTTMIPVGCSKGSSENVVLGTEKVIIDDNTKDKKNEDFQIKMVAETEPIDPGTDYRMLYVKENIIQLIYQNDDVIREVSVGKLDSNNKVNWTYKNVDWGIYTNISYNGSSATKIKNDNKVYTVNKDGELEESAVYTKLIEEQGNLLYDGHDSYRNCTIDVVLCGSEQDPKLAVIDIPNEKYYVIPNELRHNDKDGALREILGIEGDRIYVNYQYLEGYYSDDFDPSKEHNTKNTIG